MSSAGEAGSKVRYIGATDEQVKWGSSSDPRKVLTEGTVYEIDHTETHTWHTKVCLRGIEGRFPSGAFEDVP